MDSPNAAVADSGAPAGGSCTFHLRSSASIPSIGPCRTGARFPAANIYYNQPMLGIVEAEFPGQSVTALIPMATQLGYALGLFLLLPLGDLVHRRRLIVSQFVILAGALALAALAPIPTLLVIASLVVGATATVAQQIEPFAASLARPEQRGATIGTVMAGILFSRTLAGFVGEFAGWRAMFWISVPPDPARFWSPASLTILCDPNMLEFNRQTSDVQRKAEAPQLPPVSTNGEKRSRFR